MKKAEPKSKTSKAAKPKAAPSSASTSKPKEKPVKAVAQKPINTPKKAGITPAGKSVTAPALKSGSAPGKGVSSKPPLPGTPPSRPRPRRRKPKPAPPKPPVKPGHQSGSGKPTKTERLSKSGSGNPNKPQKLIQVVPSHKPSHISLLPLKSEKMLMRFGKPEKRVLFKVDFLLKASPTIVYHFITTPSALVRWFCDAVDITGEYYTFSWKGNTEVAELLDDIEDERLRFRWLDGEDDDEFFEYRLSTSDITDETIFEIYDFAWED
ncbi:MAG: START-like domain-containing protein, partial [Saprospiraceae bacterium]